MALALALGGVASSHDGDTENPRGLHAVQRLVACTQRPAITNKSAKTRNQQGTITQNPWEVAGVAGVLPSTQV